MYISNKRNIFSYDKNVKICKSVKSLYIFFTSIIMAKTLKNTQKPWLLPFISKIMEILKNVSNKCC